MNSQETAFGIVLFGVGGALGILSLAMLIVTFQMVPLNIGNLAQGIGAGFLGFVMLGRGLLVFIEAAVSKKHSAGWRISILGEY
jgi:hypothetical protein